MTIERDVRVVRVQIPCLVQAQFQAVKSAETAANSRQVSRGMGQNLHDIEARQHGKGMEIRAVFSLLARCNFWRFPWLKTWVSPSSVPDHPQRYSHREYAI